MTIDLSYLRMVSDGSKDFEKEILETSLQYLPTELDLLFKAISTRNYPDIKAKAHKLKSSFNVVGINHESILEQLDINSSLDSNVLDQFAERLRQIFDESLVLLKKELEENYNEQNINS
jgi:hypothetical protein